MGTEPEGTYELWPTEHSLSLIESLTEYLTTTFALSDAHAARSLAEFLQDPDRGMFKGPYVRLRLPFASKNDALDAAGRPRSLDFYPAEYPPYGHQVAAFDRLTSKAEAPQIFRRPEPTLVTTGTGSGKTEAFLFPILDHVLRAKREGITGTKALILYPMNALAGDQADRLKHLILDHPELSGVRAGLYTGQESGDRAQVTADGLITNRFAIRSDPPDILLTNYKMLDQMLLRAEDAKLWQDSATSLQYLVLDEFHTYDGAQGTDVAMLLRRLGAKLKSSWPDHLDSLQHGPTEADRALPLGQITPVATSATLGGPITGEETSPMLDFAQTIFGTDFDAEAVVAETRVGITEWLNTDDADTAVQHQIPPEPRPAAEILPRIAEVNAAVAEATTPLEQIEAVIGALFETPVPTGELTAVNAALKTHPWTEQLLEAAHHAVSLSELTAALIPVHAVTASDAEEFISHLLAVFSHLRTHLGRSAVTLETHLWIREPTRLDSTLDHSPEYLWSDDGESLSPEADDEAKAPLPAIFCRHCGARGWASTLTPDGLSVEMNPATVREASVRRDPKFRALMDAAEEADALESQGIDLTAVEGLRFLHTAHRAFIDNPFIPEYEADFQQGYILAVRLHTDLDAGDHSVKQICPVCDTTDAVRFVGSAVATLLTVAVTGLFGVDALNPEEKKALVFTDSVQDAAHRAGFIQARSHTFTLRTVLRQAMAHLRETEQSQPTLVEVVDTALDIADTQDPAARFMLIPPDMADHGPFQDYWDPQATTKNRARAREAVRRRLLFDADLEFGLQARFGRTLELTGTAVVETDATAEASTTEMARAAIAASAEQLDLGLDDATRLRQWVRGVLIRIRLQGGISHPWLDAYRAHDGRRWHIWGGRRRDQGMPAFPVGRTAPAFPRIGRSEKPQDSGMDAVTTTVAWYSWWTRRALGVGREVSGHLARALFEQLAEAGVLDRTTAQDSAATSYAVAPERIRIQLTREADLAGKTHVLRCSACRAKTFGTAHVVAEMSQAPCMNRRCLGVLEPEAFTEATYYRNTLYAAERSARVIAREHSSLLADATRLDYEAAFRSSQQDPGAPNVLVATPTLEMGIDIGSLSTVMLSSMPTSVASYLQRVGRAGRLSGNSLALAFVRGRGVHLPKVHDPLSIINGEVRPPATYLEADEILRRQFIAHCGDILAATTDAPGPRNLAQALRTTDPESYLGRMMAMLGSRGPAVVEGFLHQFGQELSHHAADQLRRWVLGAADQPGDTPLETRLHTASRRYNDDLVELTARKDTLVNQTIPGLRENLETAKHATEPGSKQLDDAKADLSAAQGSLIRLEIALRDMTTGNWWIAGLERYGLLPNYTLIEDSVTLDARISWRNETSGQWEAEVNSYQRNSSAALRDFAPGSTFYVQGMALGIDAVDLGYQSQRLAHWQLCPDCGWINTGLTRIPGGEGHTPRWDLVAQCPRCGSHGVGDTGQVLKVVELATVSAEVRRDEAQISDRAEERQQTSYQILTAADIDPSTATRRWYVRDFAFGVELLPAVTMRWLNLGARGHHAAQQTLAGQETPAPLFTICAVCGTRARSPQANRPEDHRFWCAHRRSGQAETHQVALARVLETQGALLHLPVELVTDQYTIPTLKAAVLLGLHQAFGGAPDHLGVVEVPETAALSGEGYAATTLLLHDNVPGGTGYLSEFGDPHRVHALLQVAWRTVRDCDCDSPAQQNPRQACHRCLLPHADYHSIDRVSRSAAERILDTLLTGHSDDGAHTPWQITDEPPVTEGAAESTLERRFREALQSRLETEGATVSESMRSGYLTLNFQLPGQMRQWTLTPQVRLGTTQPDFLLTAPGTRSLAIYTDGHQFHATAAYNRLADDAEKRHGLRTEGSYLPWAITSDDVDTFASGTPAASSQAADGRSATAGPDATGGRSATTDGPLNWIDDRMLAGLRDRGDLDPRLLQATRTSAMHLLWEWIHRPEDAAFAQLADTITLATLPLPQSSSAPGEQPTSLEDLPQAEFDDAHLPTDILARRLRTGAAASDRWWRRRLGAADLHVAGSPDSLGAMRVVYSLDDDPAALAEPTHARQWREWLLLTTVLGFRHPGSTALITRRSAETILAADYAALDHTSPDRTAATTADLSYAGPDIPMQWRQLVDEALDEDEAEILRTLAAAGSPMPEIGAEYGDGIPVDLAFPDQQVAVLISADQQAEQTLTTHGWRVLVAPEPAAVVEELRS